MAHYSTLRGYDFSSTGIEDVRGVAVYGPNDKKLGKIHDVIFDHTNGNITYVIIDTGGWLTTKKFLVPANQLSDSAKHDKAFVVDLTQEQIERFPPYDESDLDTEERWSSYENRYRDVWSEGSILHREGSNRTVTPPPTTTGKPSQGQPLGTDARLQQESDLAAAEAPTDRVFPTSGNEWDRNAVGGAVGSRWETFQEDLRRRRKEVTGTCVRCGKTADPETRDDDLRRTGT
jgi:sporulation protein YlmC with PRC-barrel domain